MKNSNKLWVSFILIISLYNYSLAQTSLGSSKNFLNNLKQDLASNSAKGFNNSLSLKASDEKSFQAKINFQKADASSEFLIGEIKNVSGSSFYVKIVDNLVEGHIILRNSKEAYKYYSDKAGNAFVSKVDINSLICIDYNNVSPNKKSKTDDNTTQMKIAPQLLNLQSFPGAAGCVMLDFDGYYLPAGNYWNNGNPINALPSGLSDSDILEHWEVVAEDFRPFNLNITTNEAVFNSYPRSRRMRVVITPTDTAAPGYGGVAYIGSFNWDNDVPCWVFNVSGKIGGDTSSHEIGHTFDLQHDGRSNPQEEYFYGDRTWGPIMGAAYYAQVGQWSRGEYNYANNLEDDVSIITSPKFGVGYRGDDYGDYAGNSTDLTYDGNGTVYQKEGVITSEADIDFFSFTTAGGYVYLNVNTVPRNGNLDVIVRLYNASGVEIANYTNAAPAALNASLSAYLGAGKYYISVDGIGYGNPGSGGYSAYGSIGSYTITGTIPPSNIKVPVPIYYYYQTDGGGNNFYSKTYYSNIAMYGHTYAGIPFKAYDTNVNGTVPVHRFFNGQYVDHFYTINYIDLSPYGFVYEGEEFYAYNYQYPGTVPVYRYFSPGLINHYYTTDFSILGYGAYGYDYEGIEFYAFPADFAGKLSNNNIIDKKESLVENAKIIAFPNPTKGLFTLENNSVAIDAVEVSDFLGKKVLNKIIHSKKTEIDLSQVSEGIYFVKVKFGEQEKVIKVVKQ